ncbi:hypothetical protein [Pimelobacter simplex]|uniref:hypothetical protein n=1 Tax=Nocardioides simplex TaxID=2045 RepID=UPI003AB0A432
MTSDWRSRWLVTVASNVSSRDGIGWEFANLADEDVWSVFREDGGDFPVFSAARGDGDLPPADELRAMTREAVSDLLTAAGLPDGVGWITTNITSALLLASREVTAWEGEEWALVSGEDDAALAWAKPSGGRTPFAWLRAIGDGRDSLISIYQDDAVFGLNFVPTIDPPSRRPDEGSRRWRQDVPVVTGRINKVEVVLDTIVEGGSMSGLVTEVLLHGETSSSLLIAAEAYSLDEWRLYDESVVVLPGVVAADALDWIPARRRWHPTEAPGR